MSCDHVTSQQSGAIFIKPWTDEDVWLEEQKKNLYHGAIEKFEYIWVQTYQPGMCSLCLLKGPRLSISLCGPGPEASRGPGSVFLCRCVDEFYNLLWLSCHLLLVNQPPRWWNSIYTVIWVLLVWKGGSISFLDNRWEGLPDSCLKSLGWKWLFSLHRDVAMGQHLSRYAQERAGAPESGEREGARDCERARECLARGTRKQVHTWQVEGQQKDARSSHPPGRCCVLWLLDCITLHSSR